MTLSLAWLDSWVTWMVLPRLSLVTMSGCFSTSCSRYAWHLQRTSYHVLQPSHPPPLPGVGVWITWLRWWIINIEIFSPTECKLVSFIISVEGESEWQDVVVGVGRGLVVVDVGGRYPLPGQGAISRHCQSIILSHHLGRDEDRTIGVAPIVNKFLVLLRLTILNIILWSTWTFSTEKLNQNL